MATTTTTTTPLATTIQNNALSSLGNLIKLLPTGTVFTFQFLSPLLTNNGNCSVTNKTLTSILVGLCGLSCFFSTFTDSYTDDDGNTHYGIATSNGFWPTPPASVNASQYKLRLGDFVHAFFSLVVFAVVVLFDNNTVDCLYPGFETNWKTVMMVLPPAVGAISGSVFMVFPNTRHGIGYPSTTGSTTSQSSK